MQTNRKLPIALAVALGYAAQRGWIQGDSDFSRLHENEPR